MKIKIRGRRALAETKLDRKILTIVPALEGMKRWMNTGELSFEASARNLRLFQGMYPDAIIEAEGEAQHIALNGPSPAIKALPDYIFKTTPYSHQLRAFHKARGHAAFALFMEMGTGKTKVAIDLACDLCQRGKITGLLIVAPKGPHRQWVEEQLPLHATVGFAERRSSSAVLHVKSINVDGVRTPNGLRTCQDFIHNHSGHVMMIVDESQTIKTPGARRTKACVKLGRSCDYRLILSGTPIAKDLVDEWSQFRFLDEAIIGHRYLASFRAQFCIMGGFQNKKVVAHKNLDEFHKIVEPYSFRVTKEEELDLPPKVYHSHSFAMTETQRAIYDKLRINYLAELKGGTVTVANAAVMLTRLQQITSGVVVDDGGNVHRIDNPRLQALAEVIERRPGKVIVWCRFIEDIKAVAETYGERAVTYYGATNVRQRKAALNAFLDPNSGIDLFVSNPAAGGVGLNLQGDCRTAIYYSHSFNAVERWQSEDRIHRIGTVGTVTYIDLICHRSVDKTIVANLRNKKSLSSLVLDDIRRIMEADNEMLQQRDHGDHSVGRNAENPSASIYS